MTYQDKLSKFTFLIPIFDLKDDRFNNFKFVLSKIKEVTDRVLVVEQVGDNETTQSRQFTESLGIDYFPVKIDDDFIHKSKLINLGTDKINTEYVWVNDADCYLKFQKVIDLLDFRHNFIQPYQQVEFIDSAQSKLLLNNETINIEYSNSRRASQGCLYGALSFIYNKKAFLKIGKLNEQFTGWGLEDTELCYRIITKSEEINIIPNIYGIHLHHPVSKNNTKSLEKNINIFEKIYSLNYITLCDTIQQYYDDLFFKKIAKISIITLFRGNLFFLENITKFLLENITTTNFNIVWVVNCNNLDFIKQIQIKQKELCNKLNINVDIILNEDLGGHNNTNYFKGPHKKIAIIYNNIFFNETSNFAITLEDDVTPPSGGIDNLIESFTKIKDVAAVAGIYVDRFNSMYNGKNNLICGDLIDQNSIDDKLITCIKNQGIKPALNIPGGFTIYNTDIIKKNLPINCIDNDDGTLVGWDWYLSSKMKNRIYFNTDIVCNHHIKMATNYLFIHNAKCAGSSIWGNLKQLIPNCYRNCYSDLHNDYFTDKIQIGRDHIPIYLMSADHVYSSKIITCVRHPISRFFSLYNFLLKSCVEDRNKEDIRKFNLDAFLEYEDVYQYKYFGRTLQEAIDTINRVDYIFNIKTLNEDFDFFIKNEKISNSQLKMSICNCNEKYWVDSFKTSDIIKINEALDDDMVFYREAIKVKHKKMSDMSAAN